MELKETIETRRALRSLAPYKIDVALIQDLAYHASLSPSCFNHQPWRFVFVFQEPYLNQVKSCLKSPGNDWAQDSSLIVAVVTEKNLACITHGREYALFDTGLASMTLMLRAVDLGLVTHPIAGFNEPKAKAVLQIPVEMRLITLIMVGGKSADISPRLTEEQRAGEAERPARLSFDEFAFLNCWRKRT